MPLIIIDDFRVQADGQSRSVDVIIPNNWKVSSQDATIFGDLHSLRFRLPAKLLSKPLGYCPAKRLSEAELIATADESLSKVEIARVRMFRSILPKRSVFVTVELEVHTERISVNIATPCGKYSKTVSKRLM